MDAIDYFQKEAVHPTGLSPSDYIAQLPSQCVPSLPPVAAGTLEKDLFGRGIAISGAGLMGISIAAAFVQKEIPVLMYDVSTEALASAPARLAIELSLQMEADSQDISELVQRFFQTTSSLNDFATKRFILESVYEKTKIKQKHYRQLDPLTDPETVLLSNTSTICIDSLSTVFSSDCDQLSASRFCGFHFFHPVRKRTLLEVICGRETSSETVSLAVAVAHAIDKTPVVVHDGAGFLVNRLLNPYLNESLALLEEGVSMKRIEDVCLRFGMEMGPFRIMDEIGLDVTLHSGWSIRQSFPDAVTADVVLPAMIEDRRLGRKNGRGFRRYLTSDVQWRDTGEFDPDCQQILDRLLKQNGVQPSTDLDDYTIAARMFLPILLEAGRMIEDGIVDSFPLADAALVLGLGFPRRKGGICYWADSMGLARLLHCATEFEPLGKRFIAPDILTECSLNHRSLIATLLNNQGAQS